MAKAEPPSKPERKPDTCHDGINTGSSMLFSPMSTGEVRFSLERQRGCPKKSQKQLLP